MKWCDLLRVKSEFPINLWPNAVQAYHRWVRDCAEAEQALRPIRPRDAHRQREQLPRAAGQLLSRRPQTASRRRSPRPWRSRSWARGLRSGPRSVWPGWLPSSAQHPVQEDHRVEGGDRLGGPVGRNRAGCRPARRDASGDSPPGPDAARRVCRLADPAREPVVRAQHRQSRLVLAARRAALSTSPTTYGRTIRPPTRNCSRRWSGNWSPAVTT